MSYHEMTEIEKLRHLANISGDVRESLWDDMTRAQILAVYDAWMASGWDFYPDQWTSAQLADVLRYGIAPDWRFKDESPITYEMTLRDLSQIREEFDREIRIEFNERGLYFVPCPDCTDEREGWKHDNPRGKAWEGMRYGRWEEYDAETESDYRQRCNDACPCKLCGGSGDLTSTIIIERDATPAELDALLEARRAEVAAGKR